MFLDEKPSKDEEGAINTYFMEDRGGNHYFGEEKAGKWTKIAECVLLQP